MIAILAMLVACENPEETDETTPFVTITNPVSETSVEGSILIQVDATDDESVEKVEIWIDSVLVSTDIDSPWEYEWDSDSYADGNQHSIQAKAIDPSGNIGESELVRVTVPVLNTSPVATFTVDPLTGPIATIFNFDASGCSDTEDAAAQLQIRWDWENDGLWDTQYSTTKTESHEFTIAGSYRVSLELKDTGGATATFSETITVIGEMIVTDIEGNVYETVQIGNQVWMAENLKVTHYRNGDEIATGFADEDWRALSTGAFANYGDDSSNVTPYGRLYNGYAITDSRGIAPEGWHIPSDAEWQELELFLGMSQSATVEWGDRGNGEGDKLKSTSGWGSNGGDNSSGFSALPAGYRDGLFGPYFGIGTQTFLWSSTQYGGEGRLRELSSTSSNIARRNFWLFLGLSVRCIKDY